MVSMDLDIRSWLSASFYIYSGQILYMTMQSLCLCILHTSSVKRRSKASLLSYINPNNSTYKENFCKTNQCSRAAMLPCAEVELQ